MPTNKAFLGINLDLVENPKYSSLDFRAMGLYALYADRFAASLHNAKQGNTAFVDKTGVFIRFTNELAAKALHISTKLVSKFRKQLESFGLIQIQRDGLKGYKIYVMDVNQTPENVDLILPWKNHNIEVVTASSDWSLSAKLASCKNLQKTAQNVDMTVKSQIDTTCIPKSSTSLSHSSLSQCFNHNDMTDTPARARDVRPTSAYHSLPEMVRTSYNKHFGYISQSTATKLLGLIKKANSEMVVCAIKQSRDRKLTSPIGYVTAIIVDALKKGAKTVQDMIDLFKKHKESKGATPSNIKIPIFRYGNLQKRHNTGCRRDLGSSKPVTNVTIPILA